MPGRPRPRRTPRAGRSGRAGSRPSRIAPALCRSSCPHASRCPRRARRSAPAGLDRVHADPVGRELRGERLEETVDRGAQAVGEHERPIRGRAGLADRGRGREHDRALRPLELGQREASEPHRREERELERLLPRRVVEVGERAGLRPARVHDEHVDAAQAFRALVDEPAAAVLGADVGVDPDSAAAELGRDLLDPRPVPGADRDLRALADELRGDRAPEPLARGRDEHALAAQAEIHALDATTPEGVASSRTATGDTSRVCH